MSATAPTVEATKSMIFAWSTDHLEDAAGQWAGFASQSDYVFSQQLANVAAPGGTDWTGPAAASAYDGARDAQDMVRARSSIYRECASVARRGASDVRGARQATIDAIFDAEAKGYAVNEDLSVTDSKKVLALSQEFLDRKAEAQRVSEFIRWRAAGLESTDAKVAGELQAKASELQGRWLANSEGEGDGTIQMLDDEVTKDHPISDERKRALDYADHWAQSVNPDFTDFGVGHDCTNFVSQALRAGGFGDVHRSIWPPGGNSDEWFYAKAIHGGKHGMIEGPPPSWTHPQSTTWALARESHNYWTQHLGLGVIKGVMATPSQNLDPLAPSKAGLVPGDLIYYKDNTGSIEHVAMYAGQQNINGTPTDIVYQHAAGPTNYRDGWMPDTSDFIGGPAQAEFVHLKYPGEK